MDIINSLKSKLSSGRTERIVFTGIEGVPCSLVETLVKEDAMPNLAEILDDSGYSEMTSVYLTVSSVAWSTIVTGKNPGEHNIYGFIDVDHNVKSIRISNAADRKAKTIWDILSNEGRRSIIVNVPVTYPPAKINGIMVSGFLTPGIEEVVVPKSYLELLKKYSYRIDVNSKLVHQNKAKLMDDIHNVFDKRRRVIMHLLNKERWDFFYGSDYGN